MFKDYYKILEIGSAATTQEIKLAYRALSKKWHPDLNPNIDVTQKMQDINEAYAILKDDVKRQRYDVEYLKYQEYFNSHNSKDNNNTKKESTYCYDYNIYNDTLKQDINEAREYAKKIVEEFLSSFKYASKVAAKGALNKSLQYTISWIIAGFILALLGSLIRSCNA